MTNLSVRELLEGFDSKLDLTIFGFLLLFLLCSAFSIFMAQVGYFGALVLWIAGMIRRRSLDFPRTRLDLFFLFFMVAEVASMLFAHNKPQALLYMQRRILLLPIIYVLVANVRSIPALRTLFVAIVVSAVGVALWSCRDLFQHFPEYLRFQRRLSEFQIYMTAGGIMMIAILLILPFTLHKDTPRKLRWTALGLLIPIGGNLLFTFTRSSWLGFIAGSILIGARRHLRLALPLLAGIVALIVFVSSPEMQERMLSAFDPSHPNNATRLHMWKVGWRMFLDHPVVGIGDIGTEHLWSRYAEPGWNPEGHLHNNLVMWLATLGLLGFLSLVGVFMMIWRTVSSIERQCKDNWFLGSLSLGSLAALVGFHVNGLFEWNFGDAEIIMLIWAIVGLTLAAGRIAQKEIPS